MPASLADEMVVYWHVGARERERYYTFPALRLMQVLPGHALADSTEHIKQKVLNTVTIVQKSTGSICRPV